MKKKRSSVLGVKRSTKLSKPDDAPTTTTSAAAAASASVPPLAAPPAAASSAKSPSTSPTRRPLNNFRSDKPMVIVRADSEEDAISQRQSAVMFAPVEQPSATRPRAVSTISLPSPPPIGDANALLVDIVPELSRGRERDTTIAALMSSPSPSPSPSPSSSLPAPNLPAVAAVTATATATATPSTTTTTISTPTSTTNPTTENANTAEPTEEAAAPAAAPLSSLAEPLSGAEPSALENAERPSPLSVSQGQSMPILPSSSSSSSSSPSSVHLAAHHSSDSIARHVSPKPRVQRLTRDQEKTQQAIFMPTSFAGSAGNRGASPIAHPQKARRALAANLPQPMDNRDATPSPSPDEWPESPSPLHSTTAPTPDLPAPLPALPEPGQQQQDDAGGGVDGDEVLDAPDSDEQLTDDEVDSNDEAEREEDGDDDDDSNSSDGDDDTHTSSSALEQHQQQQHQHPAIGTSLDSNALSQSPTIGASSTSSKKPLRRIETLPNFPGFAPPSSMTSQVARSSSNSATQEVRVRSRSGAVVVEESALVAATVAATAIQPPNTTGGSDTTSGTSASTAASSTSGTGASANAAPTSHASPITLAKNNMIAHLEQMERLALDLLQQQLELEHQRAMQRTNLSRLEAIEYATTVASKLTPEPASPARATPAGTPSTVLPPSPPAAAAPAAAAAPITVTTTPPSPSSTAAPSTLATPSTPLVSPVATPSVSPSSASAAAPAPSSTATSDASSPAAGEAPDSATSSSDAEQPTTTTTPAEEATPPPPPPPPPVDISKALVEQLARQLNHLEREIDVEKARIQDQHAALLRQQQQLDNQSRQLRTQAELLNLLQRAYGLAPSEPPPPPKASLNNLPPAMQLSRGSSNLSITRGRAAADDSNISPTPADKQAPSWSKREDKHRLKVAQSLSTAAVGRLGGQTTDQKLIRNRGLSIAGDAAQVEEELARREAAKHARSVSLKSVKAHDDDKKDKQSKKEKRRSLVMGRAPIKLNSSTPPSVAGGITINTPDSADDDSSKSSAPRKGLSLFKKSTHTPKRGTPRIVEEWVKEVVISLTVTPSLGTTLSLASSLDDEAVIDIGDLLKNHFLRQTREGTLRLPSAPVLDSTQLKTNDLSLEQYRWFASMQYSGTAFMSGAFLLSHEDAIAGYLLAGCPPTYDLVALQGELQSIDTFSGRIARIAAGPNTMALVSDLGELCISGAKSLHTACVGVERAPENWTGSITIPKLLGRRVVHVACGAFHFAAITDADELVLWGVNYDALDARKKMQQQQRRSQPPPPPPPPGVTTLQLPSAAEMEQAATRSLETSPSVSPRSTSATTTNSASTATTSDSPTTTGEESSDNTLSDNEDELEAFAAPSGKSDDGNLVTGQLGNSTLGCSTPLLVRVAGRLLGVSCGWAHTAALTTDGVYTCGRSTCGELGREGSHTELLRVNLMPNVRYTIVQVACGWYHTMALSECGVVFTWGSNSNGQLGVGLKSGQLPLPQQLSLSSITYISAGAAHSAAIKAGGDLYMWGSNRFGELGLGAGRGSISEPSPVQVPYFQQRVEVVSQVSCGAHITGAVTAEGDAYTWGMLLAPHRRDHQHEPLRVQQLHERSHFVTGVTCGATHAVFATDKNLTLALQAMAAACSKGAPFNLTPLKDVLMSIEAPEHTIKVLQDRGLSMFRESNATLAGALPYISVYQGFHIFQCTSPGANTVHRSTIIENKSEHSIIITVSHDSSTPKDCSFSFPEERFELGPLGFSDLKCTFSCKSAPKNEVAALVKFTIERKKLDVAELVRGAFGDDRPVSYYYVFCVAYPPGVEPVMQRHRSSKANRLAEADQAAAKTTQKLHELVNAMATYVPRVLLAQFQSSPRPPTEPCIQQFPASILFIDISGFTSLNERLAALGAAGPELVSKHINAYFGSLILAVNNHGGDVLKFAGDALICMFSNNSSAAAASSASSSSTDASSSLASCGPPSLVSAQAHATDDDQQQSLALLTLRAVQCGFEIQTKLAEYDSNEGFRLTLHIGIGSGPLYSLYVGGTDSSWEYLVSGEPLAQLRTAVDNSHTGEVVVSGEAWELIKDWCVGEPRGSDWYVRSISKSVAVKPSAPIFPSVEAEAALRAFIPQAVLARLDAKQIGWMDELRTVTVLFVKLNSEFDYKRMERYCDTIHKVLQCMQKVIFQYEGMVRQFLADDKGTVLIAAFGLPPFSHDNDAVRGVKAAQQIHEDLLAIGMDNTIGVTTGRVYCGSVGSDRRQEYAMVGDIVNLSARLMVAAHKMKLAILCDEPTYKASRSKVPFQRLEPIMVKGKAKAIDIFQPQRRRFVQHYDELFVIGRFAEKSLLHERVCRLSAEGANSMVLIEGVEGMGKSALVAYTIEFAKRQGVRVLSGMADTTMERSQFYPWGTILLDLLDLPSDITPMAVERLFDRLRMDLSPDWFGLVPLLNDILPELKIKDNSITEKMPQKKRATTTINFLKYLIQLIACGPVLIVLEDIHAIDATSLMTALEIRRGVRPLMLLFTMRPLVPPIPAKHAELLELKDLSRIRLSGLSGSSCCLLTCTTLGVCQLPDLLRNFVLSLVPNLQGNPYFVEQLALGLRDSGLVVVDKAERTCQLNDALGSLSQNDLPETIHSIISSRIDRLGASTQMVLKVASVLGREFTSSELRAVYPIEGEKSFLEHELHLLSTLDLITLKQKSGRDSTYFFSTAAIRKVAYSRMLFSQRKQLHLDLAIYYQENHPDDADYFGHLAHHWSQVLEGEQRPSNAHILMATRYTRMAAEYAFCHEATHEARKWLTKLQSLLLILPESEERQLAEKDTANKLAKLPPVVDENAIGRALLQRQLSPSTLDFAATIAKAGISNVFAKDSNGWTPLHTAANEGNLNLVESLLSTQAVDVTVQNSDGNTALHYFVRQWPENSEPHCEKLLQMFVWRGASLNAANRYAETPLHSCCVRKNLVALKALLQSSANPNAKTKDNLTCVHYAVRSNSAEMLRALLEFRADPAPTPTTDDKGRDISPLGLAQRNTNSGELVKILTAAINNEPLTTSVLTPR